MSDPSPPSYQTQAIPVNPMQPSLYATQAVSQPVQSVDILGDIQPQPTVYTQPPVVEQPRPMGENIVVPLVIALK